MVDKPIGKESEEKWLVRCSQGHEFFTDYLPEIVSEKTGDFECPKCVAERKTSYVSLISEQCATYHCMKCLDDDLLLCSCYCHDDSEHALELLKKLEV